MCMIDNADGPCIVLHKENRVARKEHYCYECRRIIAVGEKYLHEATLFDGRKETIKVCRQTELVTCEKGLATVFICLKEAESTAMFILWAARRRKKNCYAYCVISKSLTRKAIAKDMTLVLMWLVSMSCFRSIKILA
jgi:hypothetical protein